MKSVEIKITNDDGKVVVHHGQGLIFSSSLGAYVDMENSRDWLVYCIDAKSALMALLWKPDHQPEGKQEDVREAEERTKKAIEKYRNFITHWRHCLEQEDDDLRSG